MRTVCQQDEYLKGETHPVCDEHCGVRVHGRTFIGICVFCTLQLNFAESCPDGPDALRGHLIGNAVAIAVATPKPGQTRPDGPGDDGVTTGGGWSPLETQTRALL